jgi:hypothetical protein
MTAITAETVPAAARMTRSDSSTDKPTPRTRPTRRKAGDEDSGCAGHFLTQTGHGSTPALDREGATEGQALVEALRSGVTYYPIRELRDIPDFTGRRPELKEEAIRGQ